MFIDLTLNTFFCFKKDSRIAITSSRAVQKKKKKKRVIRGKSFLQIQIL